MSNLLQCHCHSRFLEAAVVLTTRTQSQAHSKCLHDAMECLHIAYIQSVLDKVSEGLMVMTTRQEDKSDREHKEDTKQGNVSLYCRALSLHCMQMCYARTAGQQTLQGVRDGSSSLQNTHTFCMTALAGACMFSR